MIHGRKALVAAVVLAVVAFGLLAIGAPILPTTDRPSDSIMSLAGVTQVEITVDKFPPELRAAGLSEQDMKTRWTKHLEEDRFDVAEGKGYPKLILRSVATVDPDVPGAVAYALALTFEQQVKIERLNQTLFVPTYNNTIIGQETNAHLGKAAISNATQIVDLFIDTVKKANRSRERD